MKKVASKKKNNHDFADISDALKAVAHPERIAIIDLLCNCGCERMTVTSIYEQLKMDQPVASKHLGILKRSGLVKRETEKNFAWFRLNKENEIVKCLINCLSKQ